MGTYKARLRSLLACCAALMLLAQSVLTAGHMHTAGAHGGAGRDAAASARPLNDGSPTQPFHGDDDQCALCWAQLAASSSLIPPVTPLPAPPAIWVVRRAAMVHDPIGARVLQAFQPRAPPPIALT